MSPLFAWAADRGGGPQTEAENALVVHFDLVKGHCQARRRNRRDVKGIGADDAAVIQAGRKVIWRRRYGC